MSTTTTATTTADTLLARANRCHLHRAGIVAGDGRLDIQLIRTERKVVELADVHFTHRRALVTATGYGVAEQDAMSAEEWTERFGHMATIEVEEPNGRRTFVIEVDPAAVTDAWVASAMVHVYVEAGRADVFAASRIARINGRKIK